MSIKTWSMSGYSYKNNAGVSDTLSVHAVTADTANSPESFRFPEKGNIQTVEIYFTALSASGLSCNMFLTRDSDGDVGITPGTTTGATQVVQQSIGGGATEGFVVFEIGRDFSLDSGVTNAVDGTIYACLRLIGGTGTADVRVNWRS